MREKIEREADAQTVTRERDGVRLKTKGKTVRENGGV